MKKLIIVFLCCTGFTFSNVNSNDFIIFSNGVKYLNDEGISASLSSGLIQLREKSISNQDFNLLALQFNFAYYYNPWLFIEFENLVASDNNLFDVATRQSFFSTTIIGVGVSAKIKQIGFYAKANIGFLSQLETFEESASMVEESNSEQIIQFEIGSGFRINPHVYIFGAWISRVEKFKDVENLSEWQQIVELGVAYDFIDENHSKKSKARGFFIYAEVSLSLNHFLSETDVMDTYRLGIGLAF